MSALGLHTQLMDTARESVRQLDHHPVARQLMRGTLPLATYARYLAQVSRQISGSAPMLERAGRRLQELSRAELSRLFLQKGGEEEGHDAWARSDIEHLGLLQSAVERQCSFVAVDAYVAWTAYCVQLSPVSVLGVAWILEWFGLCRAGVAAEAMVRHSRIPRIESAVQFLRGHADADGAHVQALGDALHHVTAASEARAILLSARVTADLYLSFFDAARGEHSAVSSDEGRPLLVPG